MESLKRRSYRHPGAGRLQQDRALQPSWCTLRSPKPSDLTSTVPTGAYWFCTLLVVSAPIYYLFARRSTRTFRHTVKGAVRSRLWLRAPTRILFSEWCAIFVPRPRPCCRLTSQHGAERHQMKQHCPFAQPLVTNLRFFHTSYKRFSTFQLSAGLTRSMDTRCVCLGTPAVIVAP